MFVLPPLNRSSSDLRTASDLQKLQRRAENAHPLTPPFPLGDLPPTNVLVQPTNVAIAVFQEALVSEPPKLKPSPLIRFKAVSITCVMDNAELLRRDIAKKTSEAGLAVANINNTPLLRRKNDIQVIYRPRIDLEANAERQRQARAKRNEAAERELEAFTRSCINPPKRM